MTPQEIRFLRALAHELRNVLGPIRNAAAIVRMKGQREPGLAQSAASIDSQVQAGVRRLDQLRDIALLLSGEFELERGVVRLPAVVDAALARVQSALSARRQTLEAVVPEALPAILGDPDRLAQALMEILDNASKFSPEGARLGLSVSCSARAGEPAVADVVAAVRDAGPGLPSDHHARLMRPLGRFEDESEHLGTPGLGLGLAITHGILRAHGGGLALETASEGGLIVRLQWSARIAAEDGMEPARAAESASSPSAPAPVAGQGAEQGAQARRSPLARVLVVDDVQRVRETLRTLLEDWGYAVDTAADGRAAIAAVDAQAPDVVFLDLNMPGLSGLDTAKILRGRAVKLVLLSGEDLTPTLVAAARAAGFHDWIDKTAPVEAWQELFERLGREAG